MASHHKKESEGIALLSIYGDEDDDMEEMEAEDGGNRPQDEQEEQQFQQVQVEQREQELSIEENPSTIIIQENTTTTVSSTIIASDSLGNQDTTTFVQEEWYQRQELVSNDNFTPARVGGLRSASGTPWDSLSSPAPSVQMPLQQQLVLEQRQRKERIAIVDYGQDEAAMSPEPEEGEIMVGGNDLAMSEGDFQEKTVQVMTPSDRETPPQLSEPNDQVGTDVIAVNGSESAGAGDAVMVSAEEPNIDLLNKFLPPPQMTKCSDELQEKIIKFLALRKTTGRSYNAEVRNRKEYRNPDFLRHAVTYQDIDEIGSCFSKDVFDPHGYDQSDFYDGIEADMRREIERKEQERKRSPKIDFLTGGTQPGMVIPPKINLPIPGIPVVPGSGMNTTTAAVDTVARDGRQNKKSKWDKVDGDRKNLPPTGGQDSLSAAAAHAALLSAANAGSGYSAYAQQRRKEAEDKRSSDKKSDRRT